MDHIDRAAELEVLDSIDERKRLLSNQDKVNRNDVLKARETIGAHIYISRTIKTALVDISRSLREDDRVLQGNSTRSMGLLLPALQARAALRGRNYVSSEDIESLIPEVLNHRIELVPGVNDFEKVLQDSMERPLEELAKSTLSK